MTGQASIIITRIGGLLTPRITTHEAPSTTGALLGGPGDLVTGL